MATRNNDPAAPRYCPACGVRVGAATTKCIVCGTSLKEKKPSLSQTTGTMPVESRPTERPNLGSTQSPGFTQPVAAPPRPETTQTVRSTTGRTAATKRNSNQVSIPMPVFLASILLFMVLGVGLTLFAVRSDMFVDATPTVTQTRTPLPTLTSVPTATFTNTPTTTPLPPLTHSVASGETCSSLAAIYQVSVESIRQANGFGTDCILFQGQEVLVPQPTATPLPTATNTVPAGELTQVARPTHIVGAGESLSSIATFYGVDFETLADVNGKPGPDYAITSGESLRIPLDAPIPTPGPTPTDTPLPPKAAPELISPANGTAVSAVEQTVSLEWSAVSILAPNEFYRITVQDVTDPDGKTVEAVTQSTRHIINVDMKPVEAAPHAYQWNVVVVRQIADDENGNPQYEPAGVTSEDRIFTWTGIGVAPEPTDPPAEGDG